MVIFFSDERRESTLSFGIFDVYIELTVLKVLENQSKCCKTLGSTRLSALKMAGSQ